MGMLVPGALAPGTRRWSDGWRIARSPHPIRHRWLLALIARFDGQTPFESPRPSAASLRRRGDLDASAIVERLYQAHAATVLAYLHARLPTVADAEDMLADVFIAALRACDSQDPPGVGWLMTVARNRIADFYRRRARSEQGVLTTEMAGDAPTGESDDPEWLALREEERRELSRLIRRLPEEQQDVLALRFASGMRCPQIALVMGRSEDSVRKLLSRAVSRLRREWSR